MGTPSCIDSQNLWSRVELKPQKTAEKEKFKTRRQKKEMPRAKKKEKKKKES